MFAPSYFFLFWVLIVLISTPATLFVVKLASFIPSDLNCLFCFSAIDNEGKTALFYCLHPTMRHAKCIDFLLECGADPNTMV